MLLQMKSILLLFLLFSAWSLKAQTETTKIITTDSAPFTKYEIEADYPGGAPAWLLYLTKNLRYPEKAVRKNIQGEVVTQFIVDSTGFAHEVTIISGPKELRKESLRLIKNVNI